MNRRMFLGGVAATSLARAGAALPLPTQTASAFPRDFFFGTATSAFQIEGATKAAGKGESIWDRFTHTPSIVKGATNADVACDSYRRYLEDVALMRSLGMNSYRFSISWTRVQPDGSGAPNPAGLDYYKRLCDALLQAGIRPTCTLYHWDLPQALEDKGGWPNRDTADRFADYAHHVVSVLGDRIQTWALFNEPFWLTFLGYSEAMHAPGRSSFEDFLRATHTVNLAQGKAFRAAKTASSRAQVGSAFSMAPPEPKSSSPEDHAAAERFHHLYNVWFLHTALHGEYPQAFLGGNPYEVMGVRSGDDQIMRVPLDWLGINYYNRAIISHKAPPPNPSWRDRVALVSDRGMRGPVAENGWEIWPRGMYDILARISKEYPHLPIEITENGCAYSDYPDEHGAIQDLRRVQFLHDHLRELTRAVDDGIPVRGYHHWSLMDNFEWANGFTDRFGLTYVDFRNGKRTVKASGHYYAKAASSRLVPPIS